MNIDVAASVFRQGNIPLPDLAMQIMGARDMSDLSRRGRLKERLQSELKGVSVVTTHRGDMHQRFKIASLSPVAASEYTFEMQGKTISIVQYFAQQYQYRVKYPWLPVVLKANGRTGFPMEVLVVAPSQRFMKRLDGQQVADMIKATVQKPSERANKISYAVESILKHNQNPYMQSFGFEVGTEMMSVKARVLPAPSRPFLLGSETFFRSHLCWEQVLEWKRRRMESTRPKTLLSTSPQISCILLLCPGWKTRCRKHSKHAFAEMGENGREHSSIQCQSACFECGSICSWICQAYTSRCVQICDSNIWNAMSDARLYP